HSQQRPRRCRFYRRRAQERRRRSAPASWNFLIIVSDNLARASGWSRQFTLEQIPPATTRPAPYTASCLKGRGVGPLASHTIDVANYGTRRHDGGYRGRVLLDHSTGIVGGSPRLVSFRAFEPKFWFDPCPFG